MGLAPPPTRRHELAEFLRHRREATTPDSVGLAANGNRRTPGLRREEVSQLAGVGLSWYTWLEQGREITPSPSVERPGTPEDFHPLRGKRGPLRPRRGAPESDRARPVGHGKSGLVPRRNQGPRGGLEIRACVCVGGLRRMRPRSWRFAGLGRSWRSVLHPRRRGYAHLSEPHPVAGGRYAQGRTGWQASPLRHGGALTGGLFVV